MAVQPIFSAGTGIADAIHRLLLSQQRPADLEKSIDKAMAFWISFIISKQTAAQKSAIKTYLMGRARRGGAPVRRTLKSGKESTAARYLELKNTTAAAIVYKTNYKGARQLDAKAFYGVVGRYIAARQYSAGHHKAGFRPALQTFKVRGGLTAAGAIPRYSRVRSTATAAHSASAGNVTASASNVAAGVELNPTGGMPAVESSEAEVVIQLEKFILANLRQAAERAGLNIR